MVHMRDGGGLDESGNKRWRAVNRLWLYDLLRCGLREREESKSLGLFT